MSRSEPVTFNVTTSQTSSASLRTPLPRAWPRPSAAPRPPLGREAGCGSRQGRETRTAEPRSGRPG